MGLFDTIKGLVKKKDEFAELGDLGDLGEIGKEEPAVLGQELPSMPPAPSFEPTGMMPPSAPQQPQYQEYGKQISAAEMESLRAKLDVISSKLDTIKVQLDSLNQRLSTIENSVRPSGTGQRYY